jgi:flagellum-specific ATP synthase
MNALVGSVLEAIENLPKRNFLRAQGRVTRFDGQIIECDGFPVSVGAICKVHGEQDKSVEAEVIGFREGLGLNLLIRAAWSKWGAVFWAA